MYQVELSLSLGRHSYKFSIDGEWLLDPDNKITEDDGMGGKNSVLIVNETEQAPTIYADRRARGSITLCCPLG